MSSMFLYEVFHDRAEKREEYREGWALVPPLWDYLWIAHIDPCGVRAPLNALDKLWPVAGSPVVPASHRHALALTFDHHYVSSENVFQLGDYLHSIARELPSCFVALRHALYDFEDRLAYIAGPKNPDRLGFAICTSLNDYWEDWNPHLNPATEIMTYVDAATRAESARLDAHHARYAENHSGVRRAAVLQFPSDRASA